MPAKTTRRGELRKIPGTRIIKLKGLKAVLSALLIPFLIASCSGANILAPLTATPVFIGTAPPAGTRVADLFGSSRPSSGFTPNAPTWARSRM